MYYFESILSSSLLSLDLEEPDLISYFNYYVFLTLVCSAVCSAVGGEIRRLDLDESIDLRVLFKESIS
jgi:hypothetical protein